MSRHVVALSGGVGGARLAHGLMQILEPDMLTVIVNTGDDFRHLGLWISPDIDSVVYALADLEDTERGWGRRDESWAFMTALRQLGGPTWFQLGDRDLAMHVQRSQRLEQGDSLSSVTARICTMLGIRAQVLPMSDDPVATRVNTTEGELSFQEYFVGRQCEPAVSGFRFDGAAQAHANPAALAALREPALRAVVICPSNPFVSIDPILAVPGMRDALLAVPAPIIAVTPIIGGRAVKGPAAKMMAELGIPCGANAVAAHYAGLADAFVLDHADTPASKDDRIGGGPRVFGAQTLMRSVDDRRLLAASVLSIADQLLKNMS